MSEYYNNIRVHNILLKYQTKKYKSRVQGGRSAYDLQYVIIPRRCILLYNICCTIYVPFNGVQIILIDRI